MLFALQPSVVATTEGGTGLGYSKISIRGTDASRLNVSMNGITLNDAESEEVFWVDIPFIQSFLKSAQIQRGVGTSTAGTASFGGGINMMTASPSEKAYGNAEFSLGSYNTYITSIGAGTGISKSGLSFDARYSHSETDGYIRNAYGKLNSLFTSFGWKNKNNLLRANYIYGDQHTGITWEGISLEKYYSDRRYNPSGEYYDAAGNVHYYDNETDNYKQHYIQVFYTHKFNQHLAWNSALNYTGGSGYYENYKGSAKFSKYGIDPQVIDGVTYKKSDIIIRQQLGNDYFSGYTGLSYVNNGLDLSGGAGYSYYGGDHWGNIIWSMYNNNIEENLQYYKNDGRKKELNFFVRANYEFGQYLIAYSELQYRNINYKMRGIDKDFFSLYNNKKYNFINGTFGLTCNLNVNNKFYASVSVAHRDPSRSDIKESIKAKRQEELNSERLVDYEIGYKYTSGKFTAMANLYLMEYKDQLVATGKLSETGHVVKQNAPNSYRRGVELVLGWQPVSLIRLDGNLTLSRNKIRNFTSYVDTYDNPNDWTPLAQTQINYNTTNIAFSPDYTAMVMLTCTPTNTISFSLSNKFVGKQYMDNSSSADSKVPAYMTSSLNASKSLRLKNGSKIVLSGTVDNLFDNRYYAYGWIYRAVFADGSKQHLEQGVFPQAKINFIIRIAYEF
jgi:iron complex outermembrane recepter protein